MEPVGCDGKNTSLMQTPKVIRSNTRTSGLEKDSYGTPSSTVGSDISSLCLERNALPPLQRALTMKVVNDSEDLERSLSTNNKNGTSQSNDNLQDPEFEVKLTPSDSQNPLSWPLWYRIFILLSVSFGSFSVVIHGTIYMRDVPGMLEEFHKSDKTTATLGLTTCLFGVAAGSLVLAPLSEVYGRRLIYSVSMFFNCLLILPCALAQSLEMIVITRFFSAFAGAVMHSNSAGSICDNFPGKYKPLAISFWSFAPLNGPVIGPILGGIISSKLGWRWNNWIVMIISGTSFLLLSSINETYMPVLVRNKVSRLRKETGDNRWWSRYDHDSNIIQRLKTNLTRPCVLLITEPLLWCWNIYIAITYGTLYICFIAYPIVFGEIRGWSQSNTGLGFLGIGIGTAIAIASEPLLRYIINLHQKDPKTGQVPPEASVIVICLASILCPLAHVWFAWTSSPASIHWVWPIMAGVPFGAGYCFTLVYGINYISNCYGIYASSALVGNIVLRSMIGGLLPLAGSSMYGKLGPQWAGTVLSALSLLLIPIPFTFYIKGHKIRARSSFLHRMKTQLVDSQREGPTVAVTSKRFNK